MCGHVWAHAYAVTQYLCSGFNSVCQQKFVMAVQYSFIETLLNLEIIKIHSFEMGDIVLFLPTIRPKGTTYGFQLCIHYIWQ